MWGGHTFGGGKQCEPVKMRYRNNGLIIVVVFKCILNKLQKYAFWLYKVIVSLVKFESGYGSDFKM